MIYFCFWTARLASCFTFLAELRYLYLGIIQQRDDDDAGVRLVLQALRQLTSPHLRSLTIYVVLSQKMSSYAFDAWSELGKLIDSPQFSRTLCELVIEFQDSEWRNIEAVQARDAWVAEKFPLCAAHGILRIYSFANPAGSC